MCVKPSKATAERKKNLELRLLLLDSIQKAVSRKLTDKELDALVEGVEQKLAKMRKKEQADVTP
jgi:hypothetical protein